MLIKASLAAVQSRKIFKLGTLVDSLTLCAVHLLSGDIRLLKMKIKPLQRIVYGLRRYDRARAKVGCSIFLMCFAWLIGYLGAGGFCRGCRFVAPLTVFELFADDHA